MSGPIGQWHYPKRRHLRVCRETTWGECPAGPEWRCVPISGNGFTVASRRSLFRPENSFGGDSQVVVLPEHLTTRGILRTKLYPELAEFLLAMGLDRTGGLGSYCLDHFTPADPRRITGAATDRLRLTAGEDGVDLKLRLIAAAEEPNGALSEDDFDYSGVGTVPFAFRGAAVTLNGSAVTDVERFSLVVENDLEEGPWRDDRPAFLAAGQRAVSLNLHKLADGDALSEAVRSGGALAFSATLAHPEGHTLTVSLPELYAESCPESAVPGDLAKVELEAVAATDETGDDITYEVNLNL